MRVQLDLASVELAAQHGVRGAPAGLRGELVEQAAQFVVRAGGQPRAQQGRELVTRVRAALDVSFASGAEPFHGFGEDQVEQLNYWLQGQIDQGRRTTTPRPGDLIFWDTDPGDGIRYGGDLDHTGVFIGNGQAIDANVYYGRVKYDSVTLGGTEPDPIYVDVLTPNGY
ncbi:NlpC/P60 family protein [Streptomyces sp. NPDC002644]